MCGCQSHQSRSGNTGERDPNALTLRVEDMTCGHCAGTIKKAIESALPGTQVHPDPGTKLVSIRGPADLATVKAIVEKAGYTPAAAF